MNIGAKIKEARLKNKMTQSALCGDKITRNMLSAIENGKALGSLDTLIYLANRLNIPLSYLFSEDTDNFFFVKKNIMPQISAALDEKNYNLCMSLIMSLDKRDNELSFILAECYLELGIQAVKQGSLKRGGKYLDLCSSCCDATIYDTKRFESIIPLYKAICNNINSPLLEFDENNYLSLMKNSSDFELYKYIVLDFDYTFTISHYREHMTAKILIKERRYADALKLLTSIESRKSDIGHNAFLMFGVYTDMEICYRNLFDFKGAYKYSSKRLSLMEGFNS